VTSALDILAEANRVARRESLLEFVRDATPGYVAGWFHRLICAELQEFSRAVAAGERPRLMIFMPPRHGKSQIASRCFPAWHLGQAGNAGDEVMLVSYSADLANSFSYECRDIVRRDWYRETFPEMRLSEDRASVVRWRTTSGGGLNPVGVSGSIVGSGADVLCIDDVLKSEQQAMSPAHRQMIWDRYRSSIYNRLSPKGGILLLMTRWHDEDLPGRLLAESRTGGDKWKVLKFPAIATEDEAHRKRGEALHPERFPIEVLEQIRQVTGPHEWASLYQQDPAPEGGEYVRRDWIQRFDLAAVMQDMTHVWDAVCISWDTAFKSTVRSDRCAVCVFGRKGPHLYLLHAWAGKLDFGALCDKAAALAREWSVEHVKSRRIDVVIESRANGMGVIRYLQTHAGVHNVRGFDPMIYGSKIQRANISAGWFQGRRIFVPDDDRRYPWVEATIAAWLRFPASGEDEVDAMSQAVIWLGKHGREATAIGPRPSAAKRRPVW